MLHGIVRVAVVAPDDWESPSEGLDVSRFMLSDAKPQVLCVPPGFATGCAAISDGAVLLVFSSGKIDEAGSDDYRFPVDQWGIID